MDAAPTDLGVERFLARSGRRDVREERLADDQIVVAGDDRAEVGRVAERLPDAEHDHLHVDIAQPVADDRAAVRRRRGVQEDPETAATEAAA